MGSYLCFWCKTVIEGDATLIGELTFHEECFAAAQTFLDERGHGEWDSVVRGSKKGVRGKPKRARTRRPPGSTFFGVAPLPFPEEK